MILSNSILPLLTEIFLFLSLTLFFSLVVWQGVQVEWKGALKNPQLGFASANLVALVVFIALLVKLSSPVVDVSAFLNVFHISPAVNFLQALILLIALAIALFLRDDTSLTYEFWVVYLFFVVSNVSLVASQDLLLFYLLLELQSFATYILAASARSRQLSVEASLKYFVLGAFISGFFLFGLALLYGSFGTTNLHDLTLLTLSLNVPHVVVMAVAFILAGIFFKLAVFPFHFWVADVYAGLSVPTLIVFAVLPKLTFWGFLVTQFYPFARAGSLFVFDYSMPFMLFAVSGIAFGSLAALFHDNIRRFVAYSSVANMGYVLVAYFTGTFAGLSAVLFYVLVYVLLTLSFLFILYLLERGFSRQHESLFELLRDSVPAAPALSFSLALVLFSMAGVPPLAGFFAKYNLVITLFQSELLFLPIVVVLLSVLSAAYYINMFARVYLGSPKFVFYVCSCPSFSTGTVALFTVVNAGFILFWPLVCALCDYFAFHA